MNILYSFFVLLLFGLFAQAEERPSGTIVLPADDGVIPGVPEQVQWWYYTGFLRDIASNEVVYGFETCIFLVENSQPQLHHVAVTDLNGGIFTYQETAQVKRPQIMDSAFNFTSRLGSISGGNGTDSLHLINDPYDLTIEKLTSQKEPAIHYDGQKHMYAFGGYTYYYSRTKMLGTAKLVDTATGNSVEYNADVWFDRQYGNLARAVTQGWQWFAISLDDSTELMLFNFLGDSSSSSDSGSDGLEPNYGSRTTSDGVTKDFGANDFTIKVTSHWTSPHTNCTYPASFDVAMSNGDEWTVVPYVKDQELGRKYIKTADVWYSPIYWEGACKVLPKNGSNASSGEAYVELNGFCPRL